MKKNSMRFLSFLLLAMMMVSLLAFGVLAEGEGTSTNVAKIGDVGYESLTAALSAAGNGDTVVLQSNVTEKIDVPSGKSLTLELNGKTLNGSILARNATLTIQNGSIINTDKAVSALEINAGKLTLTNVNVDSARHAIRIDGAVEAVINGGTYRGGIGNGTGTYHALNVSGTAKVDIKDGTFVGPKGTTADSGSAVNVQAGASVEIYGGSFSGGKGQKTLASAGSLTVYGGAYDLPVPEEFCGYGLVPTEITSGTYGVKSAIEARIGNKAFATLKAAIEAAKDGEQVLLQADVYVTEKITISKNITISDYSTYTISFVGNGGFSVTDNADVSFTQLTLDISRAVAPGDCIIGIGNYSDDATLTLTNVNVVGDGYSSAYAVFYVYNESTLNINGGSYTLSNDKSSAGGFIKAEQGKDGNVNITDAKIKLTNAKIGFLDGTVKLDGVELTIQGGANAINQSALTVIDSAITIDRADGRALTLSQGDVVVQNSTLNFSNCSEGEIRFKKGLTLTIDENSTISDCTVYTDVSAIYKAKINLQEICGLENNKSTIKNGVVTNPKWVANIGNNYYLTLQEAFKAATSGCTIEILDSVTIDGKWDCRDYATGGSHSQFNESVTINGNGHTIKFTGTVQDNNWNTIFRFEENAAVKDLTIDISEATGAQRVISAKKSLSVDGLTIKGAAKYGIIFGEGASAAELAASEIEIKNSTLTGTRRAISDNEGAKDVKSVIVTDNTFNNSNVAISASESVTFTGNTVTNAYVDIRSYAANNKLGVTATGNTLADNSETKYNFIEAATIEAQDEFVVVKVFNVANKAELNAALAAAKDGDIIVLTADIDYGTDQLAIAKAITLDLGGKTLTTRNAYGGMSVKNNPTIKNGTIVHASNTAAIKVWNATAFENLVIDVQGKGDANKIIGGIVLQSGSTTRVGSIKNVTIKGAALTNGIETYNCGDATEDVIGSLENVTIDAVGTGMLISAPVGKAENCSIKGGENAIEIWIKGNYSASLDLVNSKVEGGVYAHDEFNSNPGTVNNGTLALTVDDKTTGVEITLTLARAENLDGVIKDFKDNAQAKIGDTYYATLADALAAAQTGDTVTLLTDVTIAATAGGYNKAGVIISGEILDGNGHTLTVTGANSTWDCGIYITGGTVKNITVKGAFRGIFTAGASADIYLDNVNFENVVYTFNSDDGNKQYGVYISDSTINGWTSFSDVHKEVVFTNCSFGKGSGYAFCRPYNTTVFNGCTFSEGYEIDGSQAQMEFQNMDKESVSALVDGAVAIIARGNNVTTYVSLEAAIAAAQADDTITLLADAEASEVILIDKSLTINGNGHKVTSSATRVFRVTTANVEVTLNSVNMVSTAVRVGTNDIRGISIDNVNGVTLTLNNCSVDFTDASANDWAYAVNVTGGAGHTVTVNGGTYEGANVINVNGANNTVVVKDAILNCLYPNNDVYYGACIYVAQNKSSSVTATGNTFNGANAVAFNVGYTPVTESNNTDNTTICVAKIGDTYYKDLHKAMVACKAGETVLLLRDVDLTGTEWEPVSFKGAFNGQGHTISNLTINKPGVSSVGFITSLNSTFENVTFTNPTVTGGECTGVIAGRAGGSAALAKDITVNGTIKVETTHSGYARVAVIVGGWAYGNYENITVDGGDKAVSYVKHTGGGDGRYVAGIVGHADSVSAYTNCTVKNITIDGKWLCGAIAGPGPANTVTSGCVVENVNIAADYSGGMFGWYFGSGTIQNSSIKNVTFTDGSTNNGAIGGYSANTNAKVENVTFENVKNADGKPLLEHVASIGDQHFLSLAEALAAVKDGETIILLNVEGDESSTEIEFNKAIFFTITGVAPKYALPVITFQNATVTIKDAEILIPELDARQNATINVVDSIVHDAGGNSIVKSYYNGKINISGTSVVHTMQVTTMGYITISDTAVLNATWQTNVYGNGMIVVKDKAVFNTAALHLTGQEYSGRDNTDPERVGKPATIIVDGATFTVGKVQSDNGADYSYNSAKGINVGTIAGKAAVLDIKNGATVNIYMANGETANIGADGIVNVDGSTFNVACRGEGAVALDNKGALMVQGKLTLNIPTLNTNAVFVTADATLVNTYVGGTVNAGYGTNKTASLTLAIEGNFTAKILYVGNKYEHYTNGEVHTLKIADGAVVNVGTLNVRPTCVATITKATVHVGDLLVRGSLTVTDSIMSHKTSIKGGTGHWVVYEDDDATKTASLTFINSTVSTNYLVVGSNSNSQTAANSNAVLTMNGGSLTLNTWLYVQGSDAFANNKVVLNNAELSVPNAYLHSKASIEVSGVSTVKINTLNGHRISINADATLKDSTIGGGITMLGNMTIDGELKLTGGLWASNGGMLSGGKLTAGYFMFQHGTYTINADIDAVYGYLSYNGTFEVNSKIHTTGTNGEVLYINGNVTLNNGAVLDSDNSVFLSNDKAVLTVKPGAAVDSNVNITASGAKLVIDATGMNAGEYANITGTVTNSVNGTIEVANNDLLYAEVRDGKIVLVQYVAMIGEQGYKTLDAAFAAAKTGDTITILAGTISEGTIKLPATLTNVTIKGAEGAILKDMTISAADGNSYSYIGLTFDGIVFDNSRLIFTGWRNGEETIENLTITNCVFKNLNDSTNTAPVHINKEAAEAVKNFTFTNNVIDGATGGQKSGVYAQLTGEVIFTNNVINNVSFRPYVIQITTDDGIADNFVVTGNTFSGSAVGRAQGLGNNAAGTDTVTLVVSGNIFKGITDAQQICYWNFNPETTDADLSKNYYDIDILNNPGKIYFNSAAQNALDLIEKGVYPYYADEAMTEEVTAPSIMVTYPAGNPVYPAGKIEYYENMLEAVPYTTNCPRLEGATITLLNDVSGAGLRFMENGMVFDLNGHTYTITAGTGSQGTNTSGFQIRPEVTTNVIIKNGTIKVAEGAPVVWMFNVYATDFIVENVTVDCTNMAWSYGDSCCVVVSREGDNVQLIGSTKIENFNAEVAGVAYNIGGTMTVGESVTLGGAVKLSVGATLTAPENLDIATTDGYMVVYANGVYSVVKIVAMIGNVPYADLAKAIAAAVNGDEVKIMVAGTYKVPTGKNITITGDVAGVVFDNIGAHNMGGASVTFNNVTFTYAADSTYKGLQHSGKLVYNNCTFNGQVFLYGASETFNNCTFNNTGDNYNVWTYGAKEVVFNGCTFNCAGKSVLIYAESASITNNVTITNSTFKASAAVNGKAAIEMDSSLTAGIKLTIDAATTATGFGSGNVSGNSLWNNKKGNNTDANNDITVKVGDETVLAPVTFVAYIGEVGYTDLAKAIAAITDGTTLTILEGTYDAALVINKKDVTVIGIGNVTLNGVPSIKGTNYKVENIDFVYSTGSTNLSGSGLIKDCTFTATGNAFRYCYGTKDAAITFEGCTLNAPNGWAIHFDSAPGMKLTLTDCEINGRVALGGDLGALTATGTTFENGYVNVWGTVDGATFNECEFVDIPYLFTGYDADNTFNFNNCTVEVNGESKNVTDVIYGGNDAAAAEIYVDRVLKSGVAKIGDTYYKTLEDALNACVAGDYTITILKNLSYDVTIKQTEGVNITIDGNGKTYSGTITIHGNARYDGAETLTIKNVNFVTSEADHYFIDSNSTAPAERYAHNVTISGCNFIANGAAEYTAAGIRIRQGFNITVSASNTEGMHSLFQGYGCTGLNFIACSVGIDVDRDGVNRGGKNGISVGTSTNVVVVSFGGWNLTGYGIRADGNADSDMELSACNFYNVAKPVVVRKLTGEYKLNMVACSINNGNNSGKYNVIFTAGDDDAAYIEPTGTFEYTNTADWLTVYPTSDYVAYIGDKGYFSINAAIAAAKAGDIVRVLEGTYDMPSMKAGITIEGVGNVLFNGTLSGTLENLTLKNIHIKSANAQRWAYAKGNLVFENVTFEATSVYALHFDGIAAGTNLTYKNCTIIGWAAMGGSPASCVFDGCTFKGNGYYGVIRTYFDATIENCTFDVSNVNTNDAYEDGIHAVEGAIVTVNNCTNANGSMKDIVNIHAASVVVLDGEKIQNAAKIGDDYYATVNDAFAAAQNGDEVMILSAGTYKVPTGKNITITGAVDGVKFDMSNAVGVYASMTFNNVTFNYGNANYKGLQHAGTMVYNNCTINGQVTLYGVSETFNNCTFNQTSAGAYNVWTYGAKEVAFNECTFNSAGKSVLIYAESASITNDVSFTKCTLNASASADGKAAIEMDSSLIAGITLTIDAATTATGFGTGNVSGNSLWNNKKGNNTDANNDITVVVNGETVLAPVTFVAKIGEIGYTSLADALAAAKDQKNIVIDLVADATLDITAWDTLAIGGDTTETITINGNGKTLTFNKLNSDWNHIITKNDAKLILNNVTLADSGKNNGPWNRYDINFACDVELNNVISNKALAFKADADLTNVTVNEKGDNYAIWIQANGQTVTINGLTVNSAGRGIKIDEQYVDAAACVELTVTNATFTTAKKAAILVKSVAGADIDLTNVNINGVAADRVNAVWVDADSAEYFGKVIVNGASKAQEDVTEFAASLSVNGEIMGYYKTLQAAINACVAGNNTITLLVDSAEDVTIKQTEGVNITIDGNGKKFTGTIYVHGNSNYGEETLTIQNFKFETSEAKHDFIWSDSQNAPARYPHNVTIDNCSFKAEGAAVNSAVAIRFRQGKNITVTNCSAEGLHSFMQASGTKGIKVDNVTVTGCKNGISIGTSDAVITNSTINTSGYGIRADGTAANSLTVENVKVTAAQPVIVRKLTVAGYNLTVKDCALDATSSDGYKVIMTAGDDDVAYIVPVTTDYTLVTDSDNVYPNSYFVAMIGDQGYLTITEALAAAQKNDTIVILSDLTITETLVISKDITLDLNNAKLTGMVYPVIRVTGNATVTVTNGYIVNNDYIFVLGASDGSSAGNLIIKDGYYVGETTIASVTKGTLTILGGTFKCLDGEYGSTYLLNCIDANYKNGAEIFVKGGTFYGFDPKSNAAEGANTSFMADGYCTVGANGAYFVVEHSVEILPAVAPTCTTTGLTEGAKCNHCGTILVKQTEIPAKKHTNVTVTYAASCVENGFTYVYCRDCRVMIEEPKLLPMILHDYVDGVCTKCQGIGDAVAAIIGIDTVTKYTTLEKAIEAAKNGDVIKLLDNVKISDRILITKTITIDLNGKKLYIGSGTVFTVDATGDLTLTNGTIDGYNQSNGTILNAGGKLTLNDGVSVNTQLQINNISVLHRGGTLVVNGGTYLNRVEIGDTATIYDGVFISEIKVTNDDDLTIYGGSFAQDVTKWCADGYHSVDTDKDGMYVVEKHNYDHVEHVKPTCKDAGYTTYTCVCGDSYTEGYVAATGHTDVVVIPGEAPTCTKAGLTVGIKCDDCGEIIVAQDEIPAKGHIYGDAQYTEATMYADAYITYTCACGASRVETLDGTMLPYVATIDDVRYATFADAYAAAQAGDTIVLKASVVVTENTVLDLTGLTITTTGDVYPVFRIQNNANVTIKGGKIVNDDYVFVLGASDGSSAGNLTIESGEFYGDTTVASVTKGILTIKGGYFEAADVGYGLGYTLNCVDANYRDGSAKIVVEGGSFYGFDPMKNAAEGKDTSFMADGYRTVRENELYIVRLLGDVDGNGVINLRDVTMLKRCYLGTLSADKIDLFAADVNGNGVIDIDDITLINQIVDEQAGKQSA